MHINVANDKNLKIRQQSRFSVKKFTAPTEIYKPTSVDVVEMHNIPEHNVTQNQLQYSLEYAYVKTQSDLIFEYLNKLKIQLISQEIDYDSIVALRDKLVKNRQKFSYKDLEDLLEEVIMRLEVEIAKLDHLEQGS